MAILRGFPPSNTISTTIPLIDLVAIWEDEGWPYNKDTLVVDSDHYRVSPAPWKKPGLSLVEQRIIKLRFWEEFEEKHGQKKE